MAAVTKIPKVAVAKVSNIAISYVKYLHQKKKV